MYSPAVIFSINMYICGVLGTILNVVLLFCIRYRSPKEMREMRYFLANMAISDIVISISGLLIQTRITYYKSYTVLEALGPLRHLGMPTCVYIHQIWLTAFFHSTISMPFGFYFRHKTVCRKKSGSILTLSQFALVISLIAVFSFVFGFLLESVTEVCDWEFLEQVKIGNSSIFADCDRVAVFEVKVPRIFSKNRENEISGHFYWKQLVFFWWNVALNLIVVICYLIIGIYVKKIYRFLKLHRKSMSRDTYGKLVAFLKVSFCQALCPLFTMILPASFHVSSVFYPDQKFLKFRGAEYVSFATVAYLPIVDAIFPLYFIRKYRLSIVNKFKKVLGRFDGNRLETTTGNSWEFADASATH